MERRATLRDSSADGARPESPPSHRRTRLALTVADNVCSSGSNFLVGIVVAREAGAAQFGVFSLAYVLSLVLIGANRALIAFPMMIESGGPPRREVVARALSATLLVAGGLAALLAVVGLGAVAAGHRPEGTLLLTLAVWLPALALQDLWRFVAFARRRPGLAVQNDGTYLGVQCLVLFGLVATGRVSATTALGAWGIGAVAGAAVGFLQARIGPGRGAISYLRDTFRQGRWMLADFSASWAVNYAYTLVVTATLGAAQVGILRAGVTIMGPTHLVILAGDSYGLPEASRALDQGGPPALRRCAWRLTAGALVCVAGYAALVALFRRPLLEQFFRGEVEGAEAILVLSALTYCAQTIMFGPGIGFKAARRSEWLFCWRVGASVLTLTSVYLASRSYGMAGAAWSLLCTSIVIAAAGTILFRFLIADLGRAATAERPPEPEPDGARTAPPCPVSGTVTD